MRIVTVPGVFRPRSDSRLLAAIAARRVPAAGSVLDPFAGSGILAVAAGLAGAGSVTAIDVSRRAVACTRLNAVLNGVRLRAHRGDLFAPVAGRRFDLVVANPPYVPGLAPASARGAARAWEGGEDGRALIERLGAEVAEHLTPGGELLLTHSSICDPAATRTLLERAGLRVEVLARRPGPLGPLHAGRAAELERRGLLAPGVRSEEVLVLSARMPRGPDSRALPAGSRTAWAHA